MIDLQTGEQTYVSRLRVRGSGLDPLAAQLRLASLFQAAEVQPSGLAPTVIVCIRQLDDPRPRTVSLSNGNSALPSEWQQSLRASIEQLARRGARPAREAVGADAPCVVFADRAELLAALAGDWCEQRTASRWWWRSLFKETIDAATLVKLWRQTPEYVPGALEHLSRRHKAVPFARLLAPEATHAILHNLTRRFALRQLQAVISSAPQNLSRTRSALQSLTTPPQTRTRAATQDELQLERPKFDTGDAPWQTVAPEAASDELDLPQQCLLGIGLTLQRAPAVARSRSFALRLDAWLGARASGEETNAALSPESNTKETRRTHAPRAVSEAKSGARQSHVGVREQEGAGARPRVASVEDLHTPARDASGASIDAPEPRRTEAHVHAPENSSRGDVPDATYDATQVEAGRDAAGASAAENVERSAPEVELTSSMSSDGEPHTTRGVEGETDATAVSDVERETAPPLAPPLLEAQIETRFGGLFHLVNLGLFLELYGDFTSPAEPGIALPIWDFVALLGRRLCGARVERDTVWSLLAQLAGRDASQQPGEDFRAPDAWRMDARWLRTFPASDGWRWAIGRGARRESRLQVIHPQRFLVLDVPLDGVEATEAQLARELEVYAHAFTKPPARAAHAFKLRGRTSVALWVERVHAYARARLCRALGVVDAGRAAQLLCERHARVFVTATHVDIVMRLAELPFEVRMSGLDRDPGWIPAAGRIVAFHFE